MLVLHNGVHVALGADLILEHFFVDAEMGIRVKVVIGAGHLAVSIDSALEKRWTG